MLNGTNSVNWSTVKYDLCEDPNTIYNFISYHAKHDYKLFLSYYVLSLDSYIRGYWTCEIASIGSLVVTLQLIVLVLCVFLALFLICWGIRKRKEIDAFIKDLNWEEQIDAKTHNKYSRSKTCLMEFLEDAKRLYSYYFPSRSISPTRNQKNSSEIHIDYDGARLEGPSYEG